MVFGVIDDAFIAFFGTFQDAVSAGRCGCAWCTGRFTFPSWLDDTTFASVGLVFGVIDDAFIAHFIPFDDAIAADGEVAFSAFGWADIAVFNFTKGTATVIGVRISVVTFFISDGDSVTALCDVTMDAIRADPTGFNLADGRTAIPIDAVTVIAGSARWTVTGDFFAGFTGYEANVSGFDLASGGAAVIIISVSVVACFSEIE